MSTQTSGTRSATSEFDRDTAVDRVGDDTYAMDLAPGWAIGGGLNGGYLLAVIGTALREVCADAGHQDPLTVTAHYLSASRPGPATVRTHRHRTGRRSSTAAATLVQEQDGEPVERITALATYADLTASPDDVRTTAVAPDLLPREACVPNTEAPPEFVANAPLLERIELLADPSCVGWAVGECSGRGMLQGWFRLQDGRDLDPIALLLAVDALPPVTFDLGLPGWAPTVELTVHVRARPTPGWARLRHATRNVAGGYFEEDCEVWDSSGRLVAQSRQLALLPRPCALS